MITAQKSHTLTWETESASAGTMEVLEIVSISAGDYCQEGQEGHETRASDDEILVCKKTSDTTWQWVGTGRGK